MSSVDVCIAFYLFVLVVKVTLKKYISTKMKKRACSSLVYILVEYSWFRQDKNPERIEDGEKEYICFLDSLQV